VAAPNAFAAGGPLGIDHRIHFDNRGLWKRSNQNVLIYGTLTTVVGGALAFGDQDELGDTFWRSVDALAVTGLATEGLKLTFQRERPSQTSDPDRFFAGTHAQSFPSGEVAAISAAVTPFIVNYGSDHPAVYALALLPVYDAVARVKTHGHWQSDVLVGAAIGTGVGLWAAHRQSPLIIGWLPGGFQVGFIHHFK
jgi:undecaprenyl-diphosphatase